MVASGAKGRWLESTRAYQPHLIHFTFLFRDDCSLNIAAPCAAMLVFAWGFSRWEGVAGGIGCGASQPEHDLFRQSRAGSQSNLMTGYFNSTMPAPSAFTRSPASR